MASKYEQRQAVSPATVCDVTPDGTVKCCTLVIETYTSPEFPQAEIVNVEERRVALASGQPAQNVRELGGKQSAG